MTEKPQFHLKLGRFYFNDEILQHEEVLELLNELLEVKCTNNEYKLLIDSLNDLLQQKMDRLGQHKHLLDKIEENLNEYKLIESLEYEEWKKELLND